MWLNKQHNKESNLSKTIKLKKELKELEKIENDISIIIEHWKEDSMWKYGGKPENVNYIKLNKLEKESKKIKEQIDKIKKLIEASIVRNKNWIRVL